MNGEPILERPDERDTSDPERLTQTHLEQVSENQRFRSEGGGPLLLEEPELSLHDYLASRLAGIMARMHRKSGRQVLMTTHSAALLADRGIDLQEIFLLAPGDEGTTISRASDMEKSDGWSNRTSPPAKRSCRTPRRSPPASSPSTSDS